MQHTLRSTFTLCVALLASAALSAQTRPGAPAVTGGEAVAPVVPTVTLLVPANGAVIPGEGISMRWMAPSGGSSIIDKYNFQLSLDGSFATPAYDAEVFDTTIGFGVLAQGKYWWRVRAHDAFDGWGAYSEAWSFTLSGISEVAASADIPAGSLTMTSAPNPFTGATSLSITLPRPGHATLAVFDDIGWMVDLPLDASLDAGEHLVRLDAGGWPAGIYLCRLATADGVITRSIVVE